MANNIQRITAKAIIERDRKILCVQDPKGTWELPGGKITFGEDPQQALIRELEEELGLKEVNIGEIVHAWTFSVTRKIDYQFIILVYACKIPSVKISVSQEHKAMDWFDWSTIQVLNMRQGYKESIKKYFEQFGINT